jgi:TolB-like protein
MAWAADRIAVVISTTNAKDLPLAENLAEVVIAQLAEDRTGELVGTRELSRLLARTHDGKEVAACVSEAACLAQLREELVIALVVEGKLRRDGALITLDLQLLDADTGKQRRHVSRTSDEAVTELVQATRASVDELFAPIPQVEVTKLPEAPAPAPVVSLPPNYGFVAPPPRSAPIFAPLPEPPPETGNFRTVAAYGTGALAVLSLSAAAVFGALAEREPTGANRKEVQARLERERTFATTANVLWVSSGVLAAISILAFSPLARTQPSK